MRLPVRKTEGQNYQWMTSLTLIPRALTNLTNNEDMGDETSGVVNDDKDEDDVQSTAAITNECSVTFEDLCNEEREDTNKWKPDPVERFT